MRYECRDCQSKEDVQTSSLNYCPQCGSSNIKTYEESDDEEFDWRRMGEKEYTDYWEGKLGIAEEKQLDGRIVREKQREISKSEGVSPGVRILIVLIGGLLVLAGAWLALSGLFFQMGSSMGNPSGLPLGITLAIIGLIMVAFGSKGECCDCAC